MKLGNEFLILGLDIFMLEFDDVCIEFGIIDDVVDIVFFGDVVIDDVTDDEVNGVCIGTIPNPMLL
jgi:hypothetical protein